jgi:Na+:H+ antiporter, NhaA family
MGLNKIYHEQDYLIDRLMRPFKTFAHIEASGGILLLVCTVIAMILANSSLAEAYHHLWEVPISIGISKFHITESLHHWINDGLMTVFFFVVGLEIKRELMVGELANPRQAALPIAGAIGGMIFPALIYIALNYGTEGKPGWGIPMATDIAFALGVITLMGKRVPLSLKVFLVALAIVDDLGAVLVIALFYTSNISWYMLGAAAAVYIVMIGMNMSGIRHPVPYAIMGFFLWIAFLKSGVHATISGVVSAFIIPSFITCDPASFYEKCKSTLENFRESSTGEMEGTTALTNHNQLIALEQIEENVESMLSPMHRLEHRLHPIATFFIMPVFALANAGITLEGDLASLVLQPVSIGIILGLVFGKQIGITFFSWLSVKLGIASLPPDVSWIELYGTAWLGGIGFTMSLFVANLAFPGHEELLTNAKIGIIIASLTAGILGFLILKKITGKRAETG